MTIQKKNPFYQTYPDIVDAVLVSAHGGRAMSENLHSLPRRLTSRRRLFLMSGLWISWKEVMLPVWGVEFDGHDLSFARTVVSTMLLVYRVCRLMGVLFFAVSFPVSHPRSIPRPADILQSVE